MKCAIYARVSTRDQNCDLQLEDLRKYAMGRNLQIVKEYVDHAVSGAKTSRPNLDMLMQDARKRKFDCLLVWKFDRFSRSIPHLINSLEEFNHLNIAFISYNEQLDTSSPMGKAMFAVIGAMAQLERDLICDRTRAGIARVRSKGAPWGRKPLQLDYDSVSHLSLRKAAKQLGCSYQSVLRHRIARIENVTV